MTFADLVEFLEFPRVKTIALLDSIVKTEKPAEILRWRPAPGRAHIAWQLMHIAATDDRHVHVRMTLGEPQEPEFVRRYAGGSTPDDDVPSADTIRSYLNSQRAEFIKHLQGLDPSMMDKKPNEQAQWTYREWVKVLSWHEAHHQGQAHITMNLYRTAHETK